MNEVWSPLIMASSHEVTAINHILHITMGYILFE